jgi:hypothetical protein
MSSLKRKIKYLFKPMPDPASGIITGEKIQLLCDHFIGNEKQLSKNPLLWRKKYKWKRFEHINSSFNNKSHVFCYTEVLWDMDLLIEKLKWLNNPFLLVFHNSDVSFEKEHLKLFESLPNLKKIFSKNATVRDERVIPLPLGIANTRFAHGQLNVINRVRKQENKKQNLVYFNFNTKTNREKREDCFQKISKKGVEFQPGKNFEDYIQSLSTYKFAISPAGSGFDTYRFWESLYLRVVPICKRNPVAEYFSQDFPVLLLDDWTDLDLEKLENAYRTFSWKNQKKMDMSYYAELLTL